MFSFPDGHVSLTCLRPPSKLAPIGRTPAYRQAGGLLYRRGMTLLTGSPSAQAIVDQLKAARVEFVIRVPDRTTSRLSELIEQDPSFTFVPVCKEDEGVSICAALSYGDRRAVLLIQHTGVLDSVNSIRSVASELGLPLVMVVGLLGKERGVRPVDSSSVGVKVTAPILDILNVPHLLVDRTGDESLVSALIEDAYAAPHPVAILVGPGLA